MKRILIAACAALSLATTATAAVSESIPSLRAELRAYYPDRFQDEAVKDPRQKAGYDAIERELAAWRQAHPDYDALDVRRECYLAMRRLLGAVHVPLEALAGRGHRPPPAPLNVEC